MASFNFNTDNIIEEVYQRYQDGEYPLDEQGVSFLLGYHLTVENALTVGFEVGFFGRLEASFSPDLDVLLVGDELEGYEIKGYRSDNQKVTKGQLYKGLGQAIALLNQPIASEGGVLKHVHLAYPETPELNGINESWKQNFLETIRETPIGLVVVQKDGFDTIIEAGENPFYSPELKKQFLSALHDQTTGTDRRNPRRGLQHFALEIAKNSEDIEDILF